MVHFEATALRKSHDIEPDSGPAFSESVRLKEGIDQGAIISCSNGTGELSDFPGVGGESSECKGHATKSGEIGGKRARSQTLFRESAKDELINRIDHPCRTRVWDGRTVQSFEGPPRRLIGMGRRARAKDGPRQSGDAEEGRGEPTRTASCLQGFSVQREVDRMESVRKGKGLQFFGR